MSLSLTCCLEASRFTSVYRGGGDSVLYLGLVRQAFWAAGVGALGTAAMGSNLGPSNGYWAFLVIQRVLGPGD